MATYNKENTQSWQKFLSPLVAAVIAVCGAGAAYLKSGDNTAKSEDRVVERIVKVEAECSQNREDINVLKADNALMKATLYQIGNDVSFIRGKMEGTKR